MARIKIEFPELFVFETRLRIRVYDLNYGAHLANQSVQSLIHEARMRFLESIGASELSFFGTSLIMADAAIQFRAEGFWGEEVLVQIAVQDISRNGFDLLYKLSVPSQNKEIARVKTAMVCFNYETRKVAGLPESAQMHLLPPKS
ncbi:MAG: thioesterase [Cytophagales bacterium]|nr:MAG: thioesterase [Cytophagales bacterium]TAF59763.1 MAG: thioesterase [Cytophagales bacterium]